MTPNTDSDDTIDGIADSTSLDDEAMKDALNKIESEADEEVVQIIEDAWSDICEKGMAAHAFILASSNDADQAFRMMEKLSGAAITHFTHGTALLMALTVLFDDMMDRTNIEDGETSEAVTSLSETSQKLLYMAAEYQVLDDVTEKFDKLAQGDLSDLAEVNPDANLDLSDLQ